MRDERWVDTALATVLTVVGVVDIARQAALSHPATELFTVIGVGALALRTVAPAAMCVVAAVGWAGYGLLPHTGTPLWGFVAMLVLAFSAGAHLAGRRRLGGLAVLLAGAYVLQVATSARLSEGEVSWGDVWVTPLVLIGVPALAGALLRRARAQAAELRRLAAALAEERQRHAAAAREAERQRIARELHDIISHSVSVMVVQAGAAEQLLDDDSPARLPVHAVRETGKEALAELRRQLGLLGTPGEGPGPMPGVGDLARLAETHGAEFAHEAEGGAEIPPGLGLAVFRVVQEALTNASRHASGARVRVRLTQGRDGIDIAVDNDAGVATGLVGSGRGLAGMRERVELYGGTFDAGPCTQGWRVRARLPMREVGAS